MTVVNVRPNIPALSLERAKHALADLAAGRELATAVLGVEGCLREGSDDSFAVEVPAARWAELVKMAKRVGQ